MSYVLPTILDLMEYANDAAARAAFVSNTAFNSLYPPAHNSTYVKATGEQSTYECWRATNPANSLTGSWTNNAWLADSSGTSNRRFHIDLGSALIVTRIYYENSHSSGGSTTYAAKNFTLWGSNSAAAFADLTYGTDTNWTQIGGAYQFDQHVAADQADPKYISITNTTAYRYYAIKISDTLG